MPLFTALYAALLGLLFLVLSVRVIRARYAAQVAIGDGGDERLRRAIRVHGNFAEYTPLALLLITLFELGGGTVWLVHALGVALLLGRGIHAWGVSRTPETLRFRTAGMALTFAVIGVASVALLILLAV